MFSNLEFINNMLIIALEREKLFCLKFNDTCCRVGCSIKITPGPVWDGVFTNVCTHVCTKDEGHENRCVRNEGKSRSG